MIPTGSISAICKKLLACLLLPLLLVYTAQAAEKTYQVDIDAPFGIAQLLRQHLEISRSLDNPRLNDSEWQRLIQAAPKEIRNLVATEGYFSPVISATADQSAALGKVRFTIDPGPQSVISEINLRFTGDIQQQPPEENPSIDSMQAGWALEIGKPFTQEAWDQEKHKLLSALVGYRYPNAAIAYSKAEVDTIEHKVRLSVTIDSGNMRRFGESVVSGLERYPAHVVHNLNPIRHGDDYDQAKLVKLQLDLQATGYFSSVSVSADSNIDPSQPIPVNIKVAENQAARFGIGVGASTNTGARAQLTYDDLDILDRGWRLGSSLRLEQRAQSLNAAVTLPTTEKGYRDQVSSNVARQDIEGLVLTTANLGVKRSWGPYKFVQSLSANYLIEHSNPDGEPSSSKQAVTMSYGVTLRRTDHELLPTRGYLFNAQFTTAPIDRLSEGTFLRSYAKTQLYYPLGKNTQLMTRLEIGAVNGASNTPETYLFRAGGDQSVRGYAYQSLGVPTGDATVGGRYLLTGSVEIVQWLTSQWGVALFTDFGTAANRFNDMSPVYGYGLGARWKSPAGPLGADIAYGEETGEYRLHFNLGVNF